MRPERRCKSGMDGDLTVASLVSPPHHLRTDVFLSNRWGPPHCGLTSTPTTSKPARLYPKPAPPAQQNKSSNLGFPFRLLIWSGLWLAHNSSVVSPLMTGPSTASTLLGSLHQGFSVISGKRNAFRSLCRRFMSRHRSYRLTLTFLQQSIFHSLPDPNRASLRTGDRLTACPIALQSRNFPYLGSQ